MALAAEIRYVLGRKALQIWRDDTHVSLHNSGKMSICADVAVLAGESRFERGEIELVIDDRASRMATETSPGACLAKRAANRLLKTFWGQMLITHSNVEALY